MVIGIKEGNYLKNKYPKNKIYGIKAIRLLEKQPSLARDPKHLWESVLEGDNKQHNSQMDVVVSLWINNQIVLTKK